MIYFNYIIQSSSTGKYYIGSTSDLSRRLNEHNKGGTKSTNKRGPWTLVWQEEHDSKRSAIQREFQIKRYKGGKAFKKLVQD